MTVLGNSPQVAKLISMPRSASGFMTNQDMECLLYAGPVAKRSPVIILAGSMVAPIIPSTRLFLPS